MSNPLRGHEAFLMAHRPLWRELLMVWGVMALVVTSMVVWLELPGRLLLAASVGYGLMALLILWYWPNQLRGFGWANRLTLLRGSLIMVVAGAILFEELVEHHPLLVAGLVLTALVMDGVDGWAARHLGVASAFGARFDMELDAFFILMLCVLLIAQEMAGPWVVLIGALRYLFLLAMRYQPWLARALPASYRRKVLCVWQVSTLMICLLPWIRPPYSEGLLGLSLLLLVGSFGYDIIWLYRHRISMPEDSPDRLPMESSSKRGSRLPLPILLRHSGHRFANARKERSH
ncbi:CDP-alcohol phosphatidyltransferase family protein [Kushneria phosphatilytica]|nr:CDP-alcohol phosphatidyltransferase family protein [Kushneria phosphatilytica]OHV12158.1 hypothetical protein BH688_05760 [Kushneria phosphatilytica]